VEDPDIIDFPTEAGVSADQVFDRYLTAIGGTAALVKITSFTATGTYAGFDTGQEEVPVEIFAKAPNQRTWIVKLPQGDSYRVFDGSERLVRGSRQPGTAFPLVTGNLDRARIEAILAFPAAIKQLYPRWRVGRTLIDDRDVIIVQGTAPGLLPVNFYFDDKSGLLRARRAVEPDAGRAGPERDQLRRLPHGGRDPDAVHLDGHADLHADDDHPARRLGQRTCRGVAVRQAPRVPRRQPLTGAAAVSGDFVTCPCPTGE
jgi:hypothetical protein